MPLNTARNLVETCQKMDLQVSIGAAINLYEELQSVPKEPSGIWFFDGRKVLTVGNAVNQLTACLKHETNIKAAIILSSNMRAFFSAREPLFGQDVNSKFPKISFEIDEAGKCLALGRSTACVFHLMRTLEVALESVRLCLGLPAPNNPNWGAILTSINNELNRRGRNWGEYSFFQEVHAQLDIIRRAWRNGTMHVEHVYTQDEARVLFDATKGLMERLASRLDESGAPLA